MFKARISILTTAIPKLFIVVFLFWTPTSLALTVPVSIIKECTTTEAIYSPVEMRAEGLTAEQKREAVLMALGESTSNPNFAVKTFKGQWFYEYENNDVIFAGYNVRSHYLKVAVLLMDSTIVTIICDSGNLRQDEYSIHRKAPLWKDQLNSKIRIQLGRASRSNRDKGRSNKSLDSLNYLLRKGFISDAEYSIVKSRIMGGEEAFGKTNQ